MAGTVAAPAGKGGGSPGHPCRPHTTPGAATPPGVAQNPARLTLIFPCYNEVERLPATLGVYLEQLSRVPGEVEVLVVDDGSTDATAAVARAVSAGDQRVRVLRTKPNHGKGFAVRAGMLAAAGELVVFTDADGSYTPGDVDQIIAALAHAPVAIGARDLTSGASSGVRRVASWLFNRAMRGLLGLTFRDTQCGLKGFRREAALAVFGRARLDGFAFDAEVLYLAGRLGFEVAEVSVRPEQRDGSKVRVTIDALRMLGEALAVRRATIAGVYDHGAGRQDPVIVPAAGAAGPPAGGATAAPGSAAWSGGQRPAARC